MRRAMRIGALWLVCAIALPVAAAPTPAQRKQARAHYENAVNHFNAGEYGPAADEFLAVYGIAHQAVLLYDAAQAYRLAGDSAHALAYYQQFLKEAPADAAPRAEVERRIRALGGEAKEPPPDLGAPVTAVKATTPPPTKPPTTRPTTTKPQNGSGSDRLGAIVEVVKAHRSGFRDCFDRWSKSHPGVSGKVKLTFYLDPDGNMDQPEATPAGFDAPDVAECMENYAGTLKYPKSPSGKFTRFSYPFDFKAK